MPMVNPKSAEGNIRFGGPAGAPRLNYNVELPGAYTFERIVPIDVSDLGDIWTPLASSSGRSITDAVGVSTDGSGKVSVLDQVKFSTYMTKIIASLPPYKSPPKPPQPDPAPFTPSRFSVRTPDRLTVPRSGRIGRSYEADAPEMQGLNGLATYTSAALEESLLNLVSAGTDQYLYLPVSSLGAGISIAPFSVPKSKPSLWLIERYTVSAYLGDFGLGRVVNCTTLLPGEELFVSVESWREDETAATNASSIFDSFQQSAQDRFANSIESQFTQETTSEEASLHKFSKLEHEGGGFLGFYEKGTDMASAGESGYRSSASSFSNVVSSSLSEHANQSNASRETMIATSSVNRQTSGSQTVSERRIRNTNLRRTLSFVFRELNQKHTAYTTLIAIDVAFGNGRPGSYERRSLLEVPRVLQQYVQKKRAEDVLRRILNISALYANAADDFSTILQLADRRDYPRKWVDATIKAGKVDPGKIDAADVLVRFRPGVLKGGSDSAPPLEGLIVDETSVVLRTDSVLGEALLGQADALDPYALSLQEEDIRSRSLNNLKLEAALGILGEISEPEDKAAAYEAMFGERPSVKIKSAVLDSKGSEK